MALFAVAIAFVVAEVFVPSGGLLSLLGIGSLVASLFVAFTQFPGHFWWILILEIAVFFVLVVPAVLIGIRRLSLKKELRAEDGYTSAVEGLDEYVGQEAKALTPLRPAGTVKIGNKRIDAITQGSFIPAGATVKVLEAAANRLVVGALPEPVGVQDEGVEEHRPDGVF
jgi:membrane-bound serine protease (ClpP class)